MSISTRRRNWTLNTHVYSKQLLNLLVGKVKCSFVLRPARIRDHAVQRASLLDNLVDSLGHALLGRDVSLNGEEAAGITLGDGIKIVAGLVGYVDGVDAGGAVVQAALSDAQADTTVGARDWRRCEYEANRGGFL